jgi:predicted membrane protein
VNFNAKKGERSVFWGIVFLTIGAVVIVNHLFGFELPLFRILYGVLLVYLGAKMVFSNGWSFTDSTKGDPEKGKVVFTEATVKPSRLDQLGKEGFVVTFGEGTLDLTETEIREDERLRVVTVFGQSTLIVPANIKIDVQRETVFGSSKSFNIKADETAARKTLSLDVTTVFGSTTLRQADATK